MKEIYTLASVYESLAKEAARKGSKSKAKKGKKPVTREQLTKKLQQLSQDHEAFRQRFDHGQSSLSQAQQDVSYAQDGMNNTRKEIMDCHEKLRGIDLAGAKGIRYYADDIAYVKDDGEYHLDVNDAGVVLTPFKVYRKSKPGKTEIEVVVPEHDEEEHAHDHEEEEEEEEEEHEHEEEETDSCGE